MVILVQLSKVQQRALARDSEGIKRLRSLTIPIVKNISSEGFEGYAAPSPSTQRDESRRLNTIQAFHPEEEWGTLVLFADI